MIRVVYPRSGSRGQKCTGSRIRIRNTGIYPPCSSAAVHPALEGRRLDDLSFGISFRLNKQLCKFFFLSLLYSTLLHLPPIRFHCVGGCWDQSGDSCDFNISSQMLSPVTTRLNLIHSLSYALRIFGNAL
jgi:hypothetical protein